jgi:redox-sensitive bicupin YhaK (pirin superfamily)
MRHNPRGVAAARRGRSCTRSASINDVPSAPGSAILTVLAPRVRAADDLGVRRLLPHTFAPGRIGVGAFVFFDHFGPVTLPPGRGLDVRPHPHIHLATVTYLFEGAIHHRDSLGNSLAITPGAVNWMTAGRGIVHSERSPAEERARGARLHGLQLWVALPRAHEDVAPAFDHHPADTIPRLERPGARLSVIAGRALGLASPVKALSDLFYVAAELDAGAAFEVPDEHEERALYVCDGEVEIEGAVHRQGAMIVLHPRRRTIVTARTRAYVAALGGEPLDGERFIAWNFVSSSRERIELAKRDWAEDRFPKVPGDELERIPLPGGV